MPGQRVRDFLDHHDVRYVRVRHPIHVTAQEVAHALHVPGQDFAKTVMVKLDGALAMAVLPASHRVDAAALRALSGARDFELASEVEFWSRFPECEIGAMPPFGNLYDIPVYAAAELGRDEYIYFNAGTHTEAIRMRYFDYVLWVKPIVGTISRKVREAAAA